MQHWLKCDQRDIAAITRSIALALLDQRVSFWMDAGVTTRLEGGKPVQIPNGTMSIHLYINGGAADEFLPDRQKPQPPQPEEPDTKPPEPKP